MTRLRTVLELTVATLVVSAAVSTTFWTLLLIFLYING